MVRTRKSWGELIEIPEYRLAPCQCHGYDHPCYLAHEICELKMIGAGTQRELAGQLPKADPASI
jgi:hypothetical protein